MAARIFLIFFALFVLGQALTFQVEPQSEDCVLEQLQENQDFELSFEVIRGGLLDIQVRVYNPRNRVVLERMAYFSKKDVNYAEEGDVKFKASTPGPYRICFDNRMSRWTAKVVTLFDNDNHSSAQELAKLEHLGPVVDSVIQISDDLENIEKLQHTMRVHERLQHDISNATNARVQWLAIIQLLMVVGMSVFQYVMIKRWFPDMPKAGRV